MNLNYVSAEESDIEPLFQLCKDLIDQYEDISQIDYSKVLSWVLNKIEKYISEYTCIFRDNHKVGYYHFHSVDGKMELDDIYIFYPTRTKVSGVKLSRSALQKQVRPYFSMFSFEIQEQFLYIKS